MASDLFKSRVCRPGSRPPIGSALDDGFKIPKASKTEVTAFATDSASNIKKARMDIEDILPAVLALACAAHWINLHVADSDVIRQIKLIAVCIENMLLINKLIKKATWLRERLSNILGRRHVGIDVPFVTRWATIYVSGKNLKSLRKHLETFAIEMRQAIADNQPRLKAAQKDVWKKVAGHILSDIFWDDLDVVLDALRDPSTVS
ncbi:hypothetical protein BCR44DRAFT_173116 [Catenaria anguillulae PL171]|uniref:Uncharacterized protein n=1 Tax=Catenaria anguillulae PL171 TaxID=765915 RepID=A0A1Y2HDV1_9FUNG|nr:hypothetical protein BCR44DRAFT_173116 [Catenaria anguillulae PL171]